MALGQWTKEGTKERERLVLAFPRRKYDYGKEEYYLEILEELPSLTIGGETFISEPFRDHLGYIQMHAYPRKQLRLVLEPFQYKELNRYFQIEVIFNGKLMGVLDQYETSLEEVWKGFCILADQYNDWDTFESFSNEQKVARAQLLIEHYDQYFGTYWDYSIFGRKFHEDMGKVVQATKQLNRM